MQPGNYGGNQGPYGGPNYSAPDGYPQGGQPQPGQPQQGQPQQGGYGQAAQPGQYPQGQPGFDSSGYPAADAYGAPNAGIPSGGFPPQGYPGQPGPGDQWGMPPQQSGMSGTTKALIGGLVGVLVLVVVAGLAVFAIQKNKDDDTATAGGSAVEAPAAEADGPATYIDGDATPSDSTLVDLYESTVYGGDVIGGDHRTSMDVGAASLIRVVFGEEESMDGSVSFESGYGAVEVAEVASADADGLVMRAKKADLDDLIDALEDEDDGDWTDIKFGAAGGVDDTYYYGAFAVR